MIVRRIKRQLEVKLRGSTIYNCGVFMCVCEGGGDLIPQNNQGAGPASQLTEYYKEVPYSV